ncbi:hypothetical protein KJ708_10380 [bacterium]|nr:hypothetical protein [bacterium]MBU1917159.1 hypothetical protein [bacterium]
MFHYKKTLSTVLKRVKKYSCVYVPVVIPASFTNELGQIRGLGKSGLPVIAVDYNVKALGFYSRYSISFLVSDYNETPGLFIQDLILLGEELLSLGKKGVLFLAGAEELLPIVNQYYCELKDVFIFTSDVKKQCEHEDKWVQYLQAKSASLIVTKTILWDGKTVQENLESLIYPVIVKARKGKQFYHLFNAQAVQCTSPNAVTAFLEKCQGMECLIQEEIQGPETGLFTFGCYVSKENKPLGVFTGRKIRNNREYGSCAMAISCDAPEILEQGLRYLKEAKYHGACEIEFKQDQNNGKFTFLEINNRLWKWHSLATACGVNLVYAQYLDAIGCPIDLTKAKQAQGKRWWLALMDSWIQIKKGVKRPVILKEYIQSIRFNVEHGIWSWRDPLPGLINLVRGQWIV